MIHDLVKSCSPCHGTIISDLIIDLSGARVYEMTESVDLTKSAISSDTKLYKPSLFKKRQVILMIQIKGMLQKHWSVCINYKLENMFSSMLHSVNRIGSIDNVMYFCFPIPCEISFLLSLIWFLQLTDISIYEFIDFSFLCMYFFSFLKKNILI